MESSDRGEIRTFVDQPQLRIAPIKSDFLGKWCLFGKSSEMFNISFHGHPETSGFKKPNLFRRFFSWLLLGWSWSDKE